jgi:tetratricopeptide (TPR) repeat protein
MWRHPALVAGLVALIVASPSIVNGFVFDDVWIIEQHEVVHELNLSELLTASYWPPAQEHVAMWRPVTLVGFAVQWAIGSGGPALFHVVNLALYGLVAASVAWLCLSLFGPTTGLVAGVLFAVHPVHVEVSANVVGQAELLGALCYLLAVITAWKRSGTETRSRHAPMLVGVMALTALGVGAKEHVVTFPATLVLLWWWRSSYDGKTMLAVLRRELDLLVGVIAIIGGYLWLRALVLGSATHAGGIAIGLDPDAPIQRAVVMLPVSLQWLTLLFAPFRLSADYSPSHLIAAPQFGGLHALALGIWLAILALAWRLRHRAAVVPVGVALFLITISVVANVVVPLEVLLAERLLFLPSVGWALAMGGVASMALSSQALTRRIAGVVLVAVVVVFGAKSVRRATVWRSNDVLFAQMLREAPNSFRGHWAQGAKAFLEGDSVSGEREMRAAIRLAPDHPQPMEDLGRLYASTGRHEPAIPLLDRVLQLDSSRVGSALALALALSRTGRGQESIEVLDAMTRLHGPNQALLVVRVEALRRAGDFVGALAAVNSAIRREPLQGSLRLMASETALLAGDCEVALAQADTARQLTPPARQTALDSVLAAMANRNAPCK